MADYSAYGPVADRWQAYAEADLTLTETEGRVTVRTYFHSINNGFKVNARGWAQAGDSYSGEQNFLASSGYNESVYQHCATATYTVRRNAVNQQVYCEGAVEVYGGWRNGYSKAVIGSITVPARTYSIPRAPVDVKLTRVSDTAQKLEWQPNYDDSYGAQPWTNVVIERRVDEGGWQTLATLDWSATNYTDSSTEVGHRYEYAVRSMNNAGMSPRTSLTVYTTPTPAASVTLTKVEATKLTLAASGGSAYQAAWEYELRVNGGSWDATKRVGSLPVTFDKGGGLIQARVRKVVQSGGAASQELLSDWSLSEPVATITPPRAPTISIQKPIVPLEENQVVSWVQNHPDGSKQERAEVELVASQGRPVVIEVAGLESSAVLDKKQLITSGMYKVRVRTKGLHKDWGAWSSYLVFEVAARPRLKLIKPGKNEAIRLLPMQISWDLQDESGIAEQLVEVLSETNTVLLTYRPEVRQRSLTLSSEDYAFENGRTYRVRITATNGYMLKSQVINDFITSFDAPASPSGSVIFDDAYAAHIRVSYGTGTDIPTRWITVERIVNGKAVPLGGTFTDGQTVIDRIPPLGVDIAYRLTAHATSGATSQTMVFARAATQAVVANFGNDASQALVLSALISFSENMELAGDAYHFADGGTRNGLPVFYGTNELESSCSYSMKEWDLANVAKIRAAGHRHHVGWVRDPMGGVRYGRLVWSLSAQAGVPPVFDVSCALTETAWQEPSYE